MCKNKNKNNIKIEIFIQIKIIILCLSLLHYFGFLHLRSLIDSIGHIAVLNKEPSKNYKCLRTPNI